MCHLSGDRITVLAGQNEAGKTSILQALRDFDLPENEKPVTQDYEPDHDPETSTPRVGVLFSFAPEDLSATLREANMRIPSKVFSALEQQNKLWIFRSIADGIYHLPNDLERLFSEADDAATQISQADTEVVSSGPPAEPQGESSDNYILLGASEFAGKMRAYWPQFVYFDSFNDLLPRQVAISLEPTQNPATKPQQAPQTSKAPAKDDIPSIVQDFLDLAKIDLGRVRMLADNPRRLGNYLSDKSADITSDFLNYWKQRTGENESVRLRAESHRDDQGKLFLDFYVCDSFNQHPDQRSTGFRWFLSFYLRLAGAVEDKERMESVVLIDEPGSYLHPKAQGDILDLLENRITKSDWVIYSTHSPRLLPAEKLHRVRIVHKKMETGTFVADRLTDPRIQGQQNADALSPVMSSIGLDLNRNFNLVDKKNVLVEGISDYYYLHSWMALLPEMPKNGLSIFPGVSVTSIPILASLMIGWGVEFCALIDRDSTGDEIARKLQHDMDIAPKKIVRINNGAAIEDLFSANDFKALIKECGEGLQMLSTETPLKTIKRLNLDKVLIAKRFSELVSAGELTSANFTGKTMENVKALFAELYSALT